MKKLLLITIIFISITSYSQKVETKYFDKKGNVANPKKAKFKETTTTYDDGKVEKTYYKINGDILMSKSQYKEGKPVGVWESFDKNGKLELKRDFDKVVYAKPHKIDKNKKEYIDTLEGRNFIPPTYGNEGDRLNYLRDNIHYPEEAKESGAQGTIYLTYVITKEGEMSNIVILRGVDPFLDYEAYRVVSEMGKWNPATLDGEAVEMQFNMPIRFILAN